MENDKDNIIETKKDFIDSLSNNDKSKIKTKPKNKIEIFQDIVNTSIQLKENFENILKDICEAHDFYFDDSFGMGIETIIKDLIFGIDGKGDASNITKVDFSKNKNLIKTIILNNLYKPNTLDTLTDIVMTLESFTYNIFCLFQHFVDFNDDENTHLLVYSDIIDNISWSMANTRINISNLKKILRDVKSNDKVPKYMKQDTMKRYYFHHVYDLKNKVKIFDNTTMIFGETNFIMCMLDNIIDSIFIEFSSKFLFIYTNANEYLKNIQNSKKST